MTPLEFFRTRTVTNLLERAHASTSLPISIHFVSGEQEGPRIAGCGGCTMCARVAELPGGKRACRESRARGAVEAINRNRAAAFLCHMRFMCVTIPVLDEVHDGFMMTVGPFNPAEAAEGLEADVKQALSALGDDVGGALDNELADIAVMRATAPVSLANWVREELASRWTACNAADENGRPEAPSATRRGVSRLPKLDPYQASSIALALAARDRKRARAIAAQQLGRTSHASRVAALGFAVLDAAAQAGQDTSAMWARSDAFMKAVAKSNGAHAWLAALMKFWQAAPVSGRRTSVRDGAIAGTPSGRTELHALNKAVVAGLTDGITLNAVAKKLGVHPTAITHRLQRTYGVSYTQYVARLRVDKAKELLRRTTLPVREIAIRVGIADASNLAKLFAKYEHTTPAAYRRRAAGRR